MTMPVVSWDPSAKLWVPSPPAPGSITTPMLAPNAVSFMASAVGVSSSPTTTSTAPVPLPDMSIALTLDEAADIAVDLTMTWSGSIANSLMNTQFTLDGVGGPSGLFFTSLVAVAATSTTVSFQALFKAVPAGPHTVAMTWSAGGTLTLTASGTLRTLRAMAIKR